jgi:hypothetical protein
MTTTLSSLIDDVEVQAPSRRPLDRLATAATTVEDVTAMADALLSHFVDRARRAGHSWTEIGTALGVSKQAVQKRFTAEHREPCGWELFTEKARNVVLTHAPAVATELGHNYVGTEHLLAAMWGEPEGVAAKVLTSAKVRRQDVMAAIDARVERGHQGRGGYTPRAWVALENGSRISVGLRHTYVGTEHLLLSLVTGIGGMADEILAERGITSATIGELVGEKLKGFTSPP